MLCNNWLTIKIIHKHLNYNKIPFQKIFSCFVIHIQLIHAISIYQFLLETWAENFSSFNSRTNATRIHVRATRRTIRDVDTGQGTWILNCFLSERTTVPFLLFHRIPSISWVMILARKVPRARGITSFDHEQVCIHTIFQRISHDHPDRNS